MSQTFHVTFSSHLLNEEKEQLANLLDEFSKSRRYSGEVSVVEIWERPIRNSSTRKAMEEQQDACLAYDWSFWTMVYYRATTDAIRHLCENYPKIFSRLKVAKTAYDRYREDMKVSADENCYYNG